MVELGIEHYRGLKEFKTQKVSLGIKPCLLFAGELFEHNHEYMRIKSLLVDMFQREKVQAVRLQGLEHALLFTAAEDQIYFRSYRYDISPFCDQMAQPSPFLINVNFTLLRYLRNQ
jgi:ribosome production factor 2